MPDRVERGFPLFPRGMVALPTETVPLHSFEERCNAGFDVSTATVDVSSRQSIHALVETATKSGDVTGLIQAAGVSPSQASPETILAVDLYGAPRWCSSYSGTSSRAAGPGS